MELLQVFLPIFCRYSVVIRAHRKITEPVALQEIDGVCALAERVWRLLLSMKGLCHVELADISETRQPPSRWERIRKPRSVVATEERNHGSHGFHG